MVGHWGGNKIFFNAMCSFFLYVEQITLDSSKLSKLVAAAQAYLARCANDPLDMDLKVCYIEFVHLLRLTFGGRCSGLYTAHVPQTAPQLRSISAISRGGFSMDIECCARGLQYLGLLDTI